MQVNAPTWWNDVTKYFLYDKDTYKRTLREDCPSDLRKLYEEYEKSENEE